MFDVHMFARSLILKKNDTFFSSCSEQANIWNMFLEDKFVWERKKTFCDEFFYVTKFVLDDKKYRMKKKYDKKNGDQETKWNRNLFGDKYWNYEKTKNVVKVKKWQIKKIKLWQNAKLQIVTNLKN